MEAEEWGVSGGLGGVRGALIQAALITIQYSPARGWLSVKKFNTK